MTSPHQRQEKSSVFTNVVSNTGVPLEDRPISSMKKEGNQKEKEAKETRFSSSPPRSLVSVGGQMFIPPNSSFARAVIAGNSVSKEESAESENSPIAAPRRPQPSNLTMLLSERRQLANEGKSADDLASLSVDEADSASGPSPSTGTSLGTGTEPLRLRKGETVVGSPPMLAQQNDKVRRCMSSKELGTLAPSSGSPYVSLLYRKGEIESSMNQRFMKLKNADSMIDIVSRSLDAASCLGDNSANKNRSSNEMRNQRRAEHAKAVVEDLCDIVADLFLAETKLLDPSIYGVSRGSAERSQIKNIIHDFVSTLPLRYALGVESPSEVLLHMRLLAAVRTNPSKVALHIHKTEEDTTSRVTVNEHLSCNKQNIRLVTLSCRDVSGLLEFLSNLLATGGSRVLDADVMLSGEGIVLDRFVVEMTGRLRLDKMSKMIEAFLQSKMAESSNDVDAPPVPIIGGPIYYKHEASPSSQVTLKDLESGVPLTAMLASASHANLSTLSLPVMRQKLGSTPDSCWQDKLKLPTVNLPIRARTSEESIDLVAPKQETDDDDSPDEGDMIDLGKRLAMLAPEPPPSQDTSEIQNATQMDFVTVPGLNECGGIASQKSRSVPLIPFEELMLIETIGAGRISTIYRAAWQRAASGVDTFQEQVQIVALKVAMFNANNNDSSNVDELRQEADIAARLNHPCVSSLVGVAADAECFCLAYNFCEGGSLLSLLTDHNRYYEYLPIALDIANGMAYLHSRSIIHRDLKPANVLLSREHRAKISDFGMSIRHHGQELTAETGTYRYMAPEVIRHESYSSNADVYSFGICLWQLITREIPFKTMTPVQAAYAVAGGGRPEIPSSTPVRLREIIEACWDHDSHKRPSFTYVAMALADYARCAFSPANVGTQTLQIANEMLATVEGNSTVNVDFTAPVDIGMPTNDSSFNIGLPLE